MGNTFRTASFPNAATVGAKIAKTKIGISGK